MENPIIVLNEYCQKRFGKSIKSELISKKGADHAPIITVGLDVPRSTGGYQTYLRSGANKSLAKTEAAIEALKSFGFRLEGERWIKIDD